MKCCKKTYKFESRTFKCSKPNSLGEGNTWTPSHKMERQLKALIWQRLAGMFLIDGLPRKLVNEAKSSCLHRDYRALFSKPCMDAMERMKIWLYAQVVLCISKGAV